MAEDIPTDITTLTVQLLSAFVAKNDVPGDRLAELIKTTRAALTEDLAVPAEPPARDYVPAVSVRKSLASPDHIISLIDGKPYKMLKRHLASQGLTEMNYRERYNLPASYPMVAPSYSDARRAVAQRLGLGRKSADAVSAAPAQEALSKPAPVGKADVKKAPAKSAAKKQPAKAAATLAPAEAKVADTATVTAPKDRRKKLSIARPKDEKAAVAPEAKAQAIAAVTPVVAPAEKVKADKPKAAAPKAKSASRPKTLQSALKAAGAHLGNRTDQKKTETTGT